MSQCACGHEEQQHRLTFRAGASERTTCKTCRCDWFDPGEEPTPEPDPEPKPEPVVARRMWRCVRCGRRYCKPFSQHGAPDRCYGRLTEEAA